MEDAEDADERDDVDVDDDDVLRDVVLLDVLELLAVLVVTPERIPLVPQGQTNRQKKYH